MDFSQVTPRIVGQFSKLGFGGAAIGLTNYMGRYDAAAGENRDEAIAALRQALDLGVNYFDTAPSYGAGLSESLYGEALHDVGDRIFLATKVEPCGPGGVRRSLERSLTHLRRERVDLLQIHGGSYTADQLDTILGPQGMLEEMQALRDEGLLRYIGFTSEDNNAAIYRLMETEAFDAIQLSYNLLLQHPYEPTRPFGSFFEAKKRGMLVATMRTATSGIFQRWIQMANPANRFDYTASLLQFVFSNRLVDVGLVGLRTRDMVRSSVDVWRDESGRIDIDRLWNRYEE